MLTKLKCYQDWNIPKSEMSKLEIFSNTETSQRLKCQQNGNVSKAEMSLKLGCQLNWNIIITEMSQILDGH